MHNDLFSILDSVESTNNYAIEFIKQGLGINGKAFFAKEQWGGKGQRGKTWVSEAGKNIILSIILKPNELFAQNPFYFSALVASTCRFFIAELIPKPIKIKWPNDLYINDRKAGGILIENIYKGNVWDWAVIGIGINVNQIEFDEENNKTSILNEGKIIYDPINLAKQLHKEIQAIFFNVDKFTYKNGLEQLNEHLYKKNERVCFIKNEEEIVATIVEVNKNGQLITKDNDQQITFNLGEVRLK